MCMNKASLQQMKLQQNISLGHTHPSSPSYTPSKTYFVLEMMDTWSSIDIDTIFNESMFCDTAITIFRKWYALHIPKTHPFKKIYKYKQKIVLVRHSYDKINNAPFQVICSTAPKIHPFKQYVLYHNDKW